MNILLQCFLKQPDARDTDEHALSRRTSSSSCFSNADERSENCQAILSLFRTVDAAFQAVWL